MGGEERDRSEVGAGLVLPTHGVQEPRVSLTPLFHSSVGEDAVSWCREVAGMSLFPWQEHVLSSSLLRRKDGKWAARDVGVVVPRQNGKGEIIIARELFGLFMLQEKKIIHSAHEFKTAKEGLTKLQAYIARNPELDALVDVKTGNTEPGVYWKPKRRGDPPERSIQFVARSAGSTRGFTADCLIYDEAFALTADMVAASAPTMMQVPNPQTWLLSSAGFAYSTELAGVRKRGMSGDPGEQLSYSEWSVDEEDFDPADPRGWAQANPSIGYGYMTLESFDFEFRRYKASDNVAAFAREHLGVWEMKAANSEIPESQWVRARDVDSEVRDDRVVVGVEVSKDRRASVSVAGASWDGRVHVEVVKSDVVGPWVVADVGALVDRWDVLGVALDASGPAGALLSEFAEAGVDVKPLGSRQVAQASVGFKEKVLAGQLVHIGQPVLDQAALSSRARRVGDLWVFDRESELADTSPLLASAIAVSHWGYLLGQEVRESREVQETWLW